MTVIVVPTRWMLFHCDAAGGRRWLRGKVYCFVCTKSSSSRTITSFLIYVLQSSSTLILESSIASFSLPSVLLLPTGLSSRHAPLFFSRFELSQSFYTIRRFFFPRYFAPSDDVRRRLFSWSLFFYLRSPIISSFAGCPSSSWCARVLRRLHPHLPVNPISLLMLLSLLRAAVDLSLLPTCRPSSLRRFSSRLLIQFVLSLSLFLFLRVEFDPLPTLRTWSLSSVAGRPDCPQELHHHRRRRNGARAVRQVYGGDTKRKKRTHSNGYSWSITIPIRWASNEQPMTPLTDLSRLRSLPRFPSLSFLLSSPESLPRFSARSLLHAGSTCPPASFSSLRSRPLPISHPISLSLSLAESHMYILGDRGEGSTSYVLR